MTNETLKPRLLALLAQLEEPLFRAAVYEGERQQGRNEGEDAERARIARLIRELCDE